MDNEDEYEPAQHTLKKKSALLNKAIATAHQTEQVMNEATAVIDNLQSMEQLLALLEDAAIELENCIAEA
jgi:hypothetical protein